MLIYGQNCTTAGQTPATAFPVCGTSDFKQETVPLCSTHTIEVPGCDDNGYMDYDPFWYRFTCFESGTLGFTITPNDLGDDYDWQLYDITGHNPDDVFTNVSLVITGNWAGTYGLTGTSVRGSKQIECGSDPSAGRNTFAQMPLLIKDHVYLLLVSHFTPTQSGYTLSFSGGTASITDPSIPALQNISSNCEGNEIILRLNKKMKCASLASNGSDFSIDAPGIAITSAAAANCATGFDMELLTLTLSKALPPGDYSISVKAGSDGNTLLDNCNNALDEGAVLSISILPKQPTPFDSIAPVSCAPQTIELVFNKPIRCSSLSEYGSDFSVTGSQPVVIDAAYGNCENGVSSSVFLHFTQPITQQGTYTIATKNGLDGNTIVDECGEITPALQSVTFSVDDTVSALFDAKLLYGCKEDTITVSHDGSHNVNSWQWTFPDNVTRTKQNNRLIYNSYGAKTISLVVNNGFCSDTSSIVMNLDNELKANFVMTDLACPNDPVPVTDTSIGNIVSYRWDFGNGSVSYDKNPQPQTFLQAATEKQYPVQLIVENNLHCTDTLSKQLKVVYTCFIAVPSAFTPNGDGVNDYLYPLNAYKADQLVFTVYNRLGQVVFQTKDRTKKWNGRFNGQIQLSGTYVWTLQYTNRDTKQFVSLHGTTVLIR